MKELRAGLQSRTPTDGTSNLGKETRDNRATTESKEDSGADQMRREQAATRSGVYSILSASFYRPDGRALEIWRALVRLLAVSENAAPAFREDEYSSGSETRQRLEVEYNRLFVGPGHLPCPPYESVYSKDRPKSEFGLLAGPSLTDVEKLYSKAGFFVSNSFKDYPDHIAVELEFMGHLCERESESRDDEAEKWTDEEAGFLNDHIGRWSSSFADAILAATTCPFYTAAAMLLKQFTLDETSTFRREG
jgi:TorA maturation chaperone TorD